MAAVNLNTLIDQVASEARVQLLGTAVELTVDLPDKQSIVQSDPVKLRQVVVNLVSNAVKYTERGSIVVRIRCDDDGNAERLEVEDTGIGIPENKFDAIRRPFEQLGSSYSRAWGGTGLGLAITDVLLTQLGYQLEIDSSPGEGSRFSVVLVRQDEMA